MNSDIQNLRDRARACKTRTELARRFPQVYREIRKRALFHLFDHMPTPKRWIREELERIATKYESMTRTDWLYSDPASFQAAHRMGIIETIAPKSKRGENLTGKSI